MRGSCSLRARYLECGARYPAERCEVLVRRLEVLAQRLEVLQLPGYSYRASYRYHGGTGSWVLTRRWYLQLVFEVLQLQDEAYVEGYRVEACTYPLRQSTSHSYIAMM